MVVAVTDFLHDALRALVIGLPWAFGVAVFCVWASLRFFKRGG